MAYFGGARTCGRRFLNPRALSGGTSAYVYRRETRLDREPTNSIATRLKEKEGIIFGGARDFWALGDDSRSISGSNPFRMTNEELLEEIQDCDKEDDKKEKKKKKKITSKDIRNHLRNIIKYHEQKVMEQFPCSYPLIDDVQKEKQQSEKSDSKIYNKPSSANITNAGSGIIPPPGKDRITGKRKRVDYTIMSQNRNKRTRKTK